MSTQQQPPSSSTSTWLITGASSGFGLAIAFAALSAGFRVIGATRDVPRAGKNSPEFAARGGIWIQLDPTHPDSEELFAKAQKEWDVDVLVNNAGYAFIGAVEDTSEQEIQSQMNLNFYAPLRAIRAILPSMRLKGRGNIILISSGAGFIARAGRATYSASKFAIEAAHEALSREVESFGNVKVLIVQPGAFATGFVDTIVTPAAHEKTGGYSEGYKGTALEQMVKMSRGEYGDGEGGAKLVLRGDPQKAADAIVSAVVNGHDYLRLMLGPDCVSAFEMKMDELKRDFELTRDIAMSTDLDEFKGKESWS